MSIWTNRITKLPEGESEEVLEAIYEEQTEDFDILFDYLVGEVGYEYDRSNVQVFEVESHPLAQDHIYHVVSHPLENGSENTVSGIATALKNNQYIESTASIAHYGDQITIEYYSVENEEIDREVAKVTRDSLNDYISSVGLFSSMNKCKACKIIVSVAKATSCNLAPGVLCMLAGIPTLPGIGCAAVASTACSVIGQNTNLSNQDICARINMCSRQQSP